MRCKETPILFKNLHRNDFFPKAYVALMDQKDSSF